MPPLPQPPQTLDINPVPRVFVFDQLNGCIFNRPAINLMEPKIVIAAKVSVTDSIGIISNIVLPRAGLSARVIQEHLITEFVGDCESDNVNYAVLFDFANMNIGSVNSAGIGRQHLLAEVFAILQEYPRFLISGGVLIDEDSRHMMRIDPAILDLWREIFKRLLVKGVSSLIHALLELFFASLLVREIAEETFSTALMEE